jgi:hypothetical protein
MRGNLTSNPFESSNISEIGKVTTLELESSDQSNSLDRESGSVNRNERSLGI